MTDESTGQTGQLWGPPSPFSPSPTPHGRRGRLPLAVVTLLMVVAVAIGAAIGHGLWGTSGNVAALRSASSGSGNRSAGSADASSVANAVDPALVDINVTFPYQGAKGAGTGIVLTSNGEILTNNHVIEGATDIQVTDIGNGKTYSASVVGYDQSADIAVLQLSQATGLQTARIGNSASLTNGESVVALGNAGGVGGTPSSASGTITALDQSITASDELNGTQEELAGLIQTNADIQSGDSGGALANGAGQVVGMITAGSASGSFGLMSASQGYAIPIDHVVAIADQIESGRGSAAVHVGPTAFLGVLISTSDQSFGVTGATISSTISGGPAARAGLTAGDTITSINGQAVGTAASLSSLMQQYQPGQSLQVGWTDGAGQSHVTTVQLVGGPAA
jgi:S1-C subfamily serine protease